ncbi:MAG: efflux RND transporter permease subunit [Gammaproteobacteria bacterium]|jgi:multidrug efflux pump subunit AcrB|nr:efflux RND transporter permease subunit [Gammaproteobacteria bacterium]
MRSIINAFVRHPVAPNLAMLVMVVAGVWALGQLTRQLLPTFGLNYVNITVVWSGASAEDVEALVTQPIEDELLGLDELKGIGSVSRDGSAQLTLEYPDDADMGRALDRVKEKVAQIRNLPATSEEPVIEAAARSEPVSKLIVSGLPLEQLRPLVRKIERDIRAAGLTRLEIAGLPKEEIAIEVPSNRLTELGVSLRDIADAIRASSADVPAGTVGSTDVGRQLRSMDQQRSVTGFEDLVFEADETGRLLRLSDIATISREPLPDQTRIYFDGKPAVEIQVRRSDSDDAIDVAQRLYDWAERTRPTLPPDVELTFYDEEWRLVDQRIDLMVSNATSGLLLVLVALFIFLNARVAFWVAVGIPVSVLAALMALYVLGGSINMIALFAMIMTLGIIVDDAIVVAEEAVTLFQNGAGPLAAARNAATRMFAPVLAASLTTIAAFMPLLTLQGVVGSILFAIPLIVICVVIASLIECFIVLPGHLRHSLQGVAESKPNPLRRKFEVGFHNFKEKRVRPLMQWSIANRGSTVSIAFAGIIVVLGLLLGGRIGFTFFPQPDGTTVIGNARFLAGTTAGRVDDFLLEVERVAREIEAESGEQLIDFVVKKPGKFEGKTESSNVGHVLVELISPDNREMANDEFVKEWEARVPRVPGLEEFIASTSSVGPGGADIQVSFTGASADVLKAAAEEFKLALARFDGVSGISDDTTYGKEQLIFELTPTGKAIGLTSEALGAQLRAAFDGELVQLFQDSGEEIEVRIRLAEGERDTLRVLDAVPVIAPSGESSSLANVASLSYKSGFDSLLHAGGQLAVTVTASVDRRVNNTNALRAVLKRDTLPAIQQTYGVSYAFGGEAEDQREGLSGIGLALPLALLLIYIILAWVFESYSWPLVVLGVIPFGIVGALFGHWLLGFDLTMLSIFGLFGMSGIVINDSIILVAVFKELRAEEMPLEEAAVEAGMRRFRAVLLTSLTTVLGITPLLFETALQAQFLKPMIISLSFGLVFGTLIVLFLLPTFLVNIENLKQRLLAIRSRFPRAASVPFEWDARVIDHEPRRWTFRDPTSSRTGDEAP